ncbi:MAG: CoA transferase, partial [Halovenus sp.]
MQLDGITVVDLSRLLPGPYGTQLLADMGAEIIKIEPPEQGDYAREMGPMVDGTGSVFASINKGKKSVTLDLKSGAGAGAFQRLVADADVVVENYADGAPERLGVDAGTCRETNPELVYCSIKGFGEGPYQ